MPKKGVFGMKPTPMDNPHAHEPKSVHIKAAKGGFVVHTMPGKHGAYNETHVAIDMPGVEKLIRSHLDQIIANDLDGVTNSMKAPAPKVVKE